MTISLKQVLYVAVIAVMAFLLALMYRQPFRADASTARGSEYNATTTTAASFAAESLVQSQGGTLGSVVITGAATGIINIYDATTSNNALRTTSVASSSILLATFPASTAAGTYTLDRMFYTGLYVSVVGTMPTTTITYRQ